MSNAKAFNSVQYDAPKKSVFDLSHSIKTSANMGTLFPVMCMEVIPGDKITIGCECIMRLAPMVSPMMHRVQESTHYFFVPNRLVWPNWEDFITNTANDVGLLPAFPFIKIDNSNSGEKLLDYFGIPKISPGNEEEKINAIPLAAYHLIFNEYYRDQNLIDEIETELTDGNNINPELLILRRRAWKHDYFTAMLPFAQKGNPVQLPMGNLDDIPVLRNASAIVSPFTITGSVAPINSFNFPANNANVNPNQLYADTSQLVVNPATLNDLREAWALQSWLEKNARGGTRYSEQLKIHFGVTAQDSRLQRPEYITGIVNNVSISEVLNMTGTDNAPQGAMAGHGISVTSGNVGSFYAPEHGFIIGIKSVLPEATYQQGLQKFWSKTADPLDYYFPEFDHLGEQAVKSKELFLDSPSANERDTTIGYLPIFSDYRYISNMVTGDFKTTLNFWHMGRIFETAPQLNQQFIECDPTHRVFAVTDPNEDKLWIHHRNIVTAVRPMSQYGTPAKVV